MNDRVCGLPKYSGPCTGSVEPPPLVSGSYPVHFVHVCRFRPDTRISTLLTPIMRCTHGWSSVYVSEISRSFTKPCGSRHASSTPVNGQAASLCRYQFSPIGTAIPAPGPTTGPSNQPPFPNVFRLPVQVVPLQPARCCVSMFVP